jgi:hypothetical protein
LLKKGSAAARLLKNKDFNRIENLINLNYFFFDLKRKNDFFAGLVGKKKVTLINCLVDNRY